MRSDVPSLTFRLGVPSDVVPVVALVESAYRGDASREGWTTEADHLDGNRTDVAAVDAIIADPGSMLLLAEQDGTPVGCCHLRDDGGRVYFGMFAVRPGLQGGGIGRRVVTEAQRRAVSDWHSGEMWMTVLEPRHELIAWYERLGFRRTGETQPFPYGTDRFGRPKRGDLAFAVLVKSLDGVLPAP